MTQIDIDFAYLNMVLTNSELNTASHEEILQ